tara:strand:+ start:37 stop:501 length:465 start_codon:yes stop_codon:yes gene_type:complete
MLIQVLRYSSQSQTTLSSVLIDGVFQCYGLEPCHREEKIKGKTRIKTGTYEVTLRTEGGFHKRYSSLFPSFHSGMLWVRNVPEFEYVLVHIGNSKEDTEACLLVGNEVNNNRTDKGFLSNSSEAYEELYKKVAPFATSGKLMIQYIDLDQPYRH